MTLNILQGLIDRCHERHEKPLKQRRSIVAPLLYKGFPYHFTVHCARKYPVMLQDLEAAEISFMPVGQYPGNDRPPRYFGGDKFLKRQQAKNWETLRWHKSWGIQIYTGTPSAQDDAPWHDIDFKYEAICLAPDVVLSCVQALVDSVMNPLLTISKSGGLRFSCRIPGYLHPNTEHDRLYVRQHAPTSENPDRHDTFLEILGDKAYSCWDARYEILLGDLLDPPVISKEVLFPSIDALRATFHKPLPQGTGEKEKSILDMPDTLGSGKLDLAKEAFLKRGYSYVKQEDGLHYWNRRDGTVDTQVSLWESEDGVWICASTPDTGLPVEDTLITDVWNDIGLLPPIPATGLPIDERVPDIRTGELSPLAIKRPTPVLHKVSDTEKIDETREEFWVQMQRAFNNKVSALRFSPDTDPEKNGDVESIIRNNEAICLNIPDTELAAGIEQYFQKQDVESVAQILPDYRLFLDPQYAEIAEQTLERRDGTQQLCIISAPREDELFLECDISKTTLEQWVADWQGDALGNFATALLNALAIRDKSHGDSIRRLRTVIQTYKWREEELIRQMCDGVDNDQEASTVYSDPNWTFWHQINRCFAHYTRNDDTPIRWEDDVLRFWVPPVLHPSISHLLVTSPTLNDEHLRRVFVDAEAEILPPQPMPLASGTSIFQVRSDIYPRKKILDLYSTWDTFGLAESGQHIFSRIQAEIERDPNVKHGIITHVHTAKHLGNIAKNGNIFFMNGFRNRGRLETAFEEAQVIWIVGMPEMGARAILERSQILLGNDDEPLSYKTNPETCCYRDERVQSIYERDTFQIFTDVIEMAQLNRLSNKTVMLITGLRIPEITDRPETLLFDLADLDVADGLDNLAEVIKTRESFEAEREKLTAETSRKEVERVLGCSTRQANRVLHKLRGGNIVRATFQEQILAVLADGKKTTPEIVAAIEGHPKAINTKLTHLTKKGEIVKIKRGLYKLP